MYLELIKLHNVLNALNKWNLDILELNYKNYRYNLLKRIKIILIQTLRT